MKIGQLENKPVTPAVSERRTGASAGASGTEASAKVALSNTVTQLASDGGDGVFDAEKVKRISDAIRDGKFEINAEAIADKLISNAQELLGKVQKR
jgi:negative regulator of flagellin synthesis FlgM